MSSSSLGPDFSGELSPVAVRRLMKEWERLEAEPLHGQGIYHSFGESLRTAAVLIIGPKDTPYAFGFYLFEFTFPNSYPATPPHVTFQTGDGRVRFNPNLYRDGTVCLSILGTWPGPSWTSSCTLRTTVLSLQSLLCNHPLRNEPGYESDSGEDGDIYELMLRYENIAVTVMQLAQPLPSLFVPFREPMVQSFVHHFTHHIAALDDYYQLEGSVDECFLFDFVTRYSPSKVQQKLRELLRTLRVEEHPSANAFVDLMEPMDVEAPEMEGRLPPSNGLDGPKWLDVCHSVPAESSGLPPCKGLQERTKQLAREVVLEAVVRALPVVQSTLEQKWAELDTDSCSYSETMLPPSRGLPAQERRVASKVVSRVVARVLHKRANMLASEGDISETRVQDKWNQMDADLIAFCSDCPICLDQINRPIVLPCRHSFCADCLLKAIAEHGERRCPTCRGALVSGAVARQRSEDLDSFFDDESDENVFNECDNNIATLILKGLYFTPAVIYSIPLFLYLSPYMAFQSWRQNRETAALDAMAMEEAIEESTAASNEALPQLNSTVQASSTCQFQSHLIPPLR